MMSLSRDEIAALSGQQVFQTARLRARRWRAEDLPIIHAVYSDPEGARWVGDGNPIGWADCEKWLAVTAANYQGRGYGMFALEDRATGQVIGFCGLVHPGGQEEAEVKYALLKECWGQGLASETVPALLDYGRSVHGLTRIIATVAPENTASCRVLEKAGFLHSDNRQDDDGTLTRVYEWLA